MSLYSPQLPPAVWCASNKIWTLKAARIQSSISARKDAIAYTYLPLALGSHSPMFPLHLKKKIEKESISWYHPKCNTLCLSDWFLMVLFCNCSHSINDKYWQYFEFRTAQNKDNWDTCRKESGQQNLSISVQVNWKTVS